MATVYYINKLHAHIFSLREKRVRFSFPFLMSWFLKSKNGKYIHVCV